MGKFSTRQTRPATTSPITSAHQPGVTTTEDGPGYVRDAKSELFLLAVTNMVGEQTFYEAATDRDRRFRDLTHAVTREDPEWVAGFVPYLRGTMNMRSAAVVMAAEHVAARLTHGIEARTPARAVISSACQRADEPAELLAYWISRHGRAVPKPIKRGIADALGRLYTPWAALKYDGKARAWRMGDVIELVHPKPSTPDRAALYRWLLDVRHHPDNAPIDRDQLPMIALHRDLYNIPTEERHAALAMPHSADVLKAAGMTWEELSGWLGGPMDSTAWEAVIPSMGYMALLRNLRNFDQAGVNDTIAATVAAKLADPGEVARSRQFPFRFLSAYRAAPSLRWAYPLEQALGHSVANIPAVAGRTLILVDTSSSMYAPFSKDGTVRRWDAAATFGVALGQRCASADVVSFSSAQRFYADPRGHHTVQFPLRQGESLLKSLDRWQRDGFFLGGGTDTAGAVTQHYAGHDRVVVITDEQAAGPGDVFATVPWSVPTYTWNLAGYQVGHAESGVPHRHVFGGLTDAAFVQIGLLESAQDARWPWLG